MYKIDSKSQPSSQQNNLGINNDSSDAKPHVFYHPIINGLQKIALYETKTMYYLIGSNSTQTKFRTLKIDRTEPDKLILTDDKVLYSHLEIRQLLACLHEGNRGDVTPGTKLARATSAFGIVGFVKFLQGYYLILVTKRRKVASVGMHSIYKIEDTCIRAIPHESCRTNRAAMEEEQRYLKLFLNVDLKANFYFSYSYDLTHSLQYNLAPPTGHIKLVSAEELERFLPDGKHKMPCPTDSETHLTYYPEPDTRYVWNSYLHDVAPDLHPAWKLFITHGFIEQVNMNVFGHSYYLTLIARRSSMFAGTRFLKRGTNFQGDVANEVETEQIVFDSAMANLPDGRFTSFVQCRGSIPFHWSQDITKMVPKPPISIQLTDPLAMAAGYHFNRLLKRHGSPVLILDLTKRRESRMHESILGPHFKGVVDTLNLSFLPCFRLDYRRLDMAYLNKLPQDNAMNHLSEFSAWALNRTGVFCTPATMTARVRAGGGCDPVYQTGTIRVNCVDCLDRTNTAQYALAKCALAHQLHLLGVLQTPHLPWDSDCTRVLEDLFEDHGDTMALQYGGSHLVHRIQTYRHTAKWSSHGSDMMQSLSRYYSNTFSDLEKQQSINVFLGVYVPYKETTPLWDLPSDFLLHNAKPKCLQQAEQRGSSWWDPALSHSLPLPLDICRKKTNFVAAVTKSLFSVIDLYNDFHRPSEMTVMTDHFQQNITSTLKAYLTSNSMNPSPFLSRVASIKQQFQQRQTKQQQQQQQQNKQKRRDSSTSSGVTSSECGSDRRRGSIPGSNNSSSDGEGGGSNISVSEELGIWPPLDTPICWLPLARLPGAIGPSLGPAAVTPEMLGWATRLPPCLRTKVVAARNRWSPSAMATSKDSTKQASPRSVATKNGNSRASPVPNNSNGSNSDEEISDEDCISQQILELENASRDQEKMFKRQRLHHLSRQFDCHSEDTHDSLSSLSEGDGDSLTRKLFPDPEETYGVIYTEPSPQQLRVFARYARVVQQTVPSSQSGRSSPGREGGAGLAAWRAHCPAYLAPLTTRPRPAEPLLLVQESTFKQDSYLEVDEPTVDRCTRELYRRVVDTATQGACEPATLDMELYSQYAHLSSSEYNSSSSCVRTSA